MGLGPLAKLLLIVLCCSVAAAAGVGHFFFNVDSFKSRKIEEKAAVLALARSFVSTYSGVRRGQLETTSPVPETFRAHAFSKFNTDRELAGDLSMRMVGVPGRAIGSPPKDDHLKKLIAGMASSQAKPRTWTSFAGGRGQEVFRTVRPVIADNEKCVSCHNAASSEGPVWRLGDVMGAFVLDVPAAAFLNTLRTQSALVGIFVLVFLLSGAVALARAQSKLFATRQQEADVAERDEMKVQLRKSADELATARLDAEATRHLMADQLAGKDAELAAINRTLEQQSLEVLRFARLQNCNPETAKVDAWLVDAIRQEAGALPEEVAVECHLALGDTAARFDPSLLQKVVVSLLSNASEAMVGKPGGHPAKPVENPKIVISSRLTRRGIEISVADNGPGVGSSELNRILDPQLNTKSFGTGRGLPVVKQIMLQHDGGLDVHGGRGQGATFTVWLPSSRQASVAA